MAEPFPTGEPAGTSPGRKVDLQICHVGMGGYIIIAGTFYLRAGDAVSWPLFACTTLDEALAFIRENIKLHHGKAPDRSELQAELAAATRSAFLGNRDPIVSRLRDLMERNQLYSDKRKRQRQRPASQNNKRAMNKFFAKKVVARKRPAKKAKR